MNITLKKGAGLLVHLLLLIILQSCCAGLRRWQLWHGPGAWGNISLQGFPYVAFTRLKLFQNLATETQVIKGT